MTSNIPISLLAQEAKRLSGLPPLSDSTPLAAPVMSQTLGPLIAVVGAAWSGKSTLCQHLIDKWTETATDTNDGVDSEATSLPVDSSDGYTLRFWAAQTSDLPADVACRIQSRTVYAKKPLPCLVEFPPLSDAVPNAEVWKRWLPRCDYVIVVVASARPAGQTEAEWAQIHLFQPADTDAAATTMPYALVITRADRVDVDDIQVVADESKQILNQVARQMPQSVSYCGLFEGSTQADFVRDLHEAAVEGDKVPTILLDLWGNPEFLRSFTQTTSARAKMRLQAWIHAARERIDRTEREAAQKQAQTGEARRSVQVALQKVLQAHAEHRACCSRAARAAEEAFAQQITLLEIETNVAWEQLRPEVTRPNDVSKVETMLANIWATWSVQTQDRANAVLVPELTKAARIVRQAVEPVLGLSVLTLAERVPGSDDGTLQPSLDAAALEFPAQGYGNVSVARKIRSALPGLGALGIFSMLGLPFVGLFAAPAAALFFYAAEQKEQVQALIQREFFAALQRAKVQVRKDSTVAIREYIQAIDSQAQMRFIAVRSKLDENAKATRQAASHRDQNAALQLRQAGEMRTLLLLWERDAAAADVLGDGT